MKALLVLLLLSGCTTAKEQVQACRQTCAEAGLPVALWQFDTGSERGICSCGFAKVAQ